jgi:hypothetical protein
MPSTTDTTGGPTQREWDSLAQLDINTNTSHDNVLHLFSFKTPILNEIAYKYFFFIFRVLFFLDTYFSGLS